MSNKVKIITAVVLVLAAAGVAYAMTSMQAGEESPAEAVAPVEEKVAEKVEEKVEEPGFGAAGANEDTDYTIEDMLIYAIQDEYIAQAEYNAIIDKYGSQRPFSNIVKVEANHINLLLPLFATYGVSVPENDAAERTVEPATLEESYAVGVEAEEKNIAMYESFLQEDLPDDLAVIFEELKTGSENHLAAFQKAAN